MNRNLVAVLAGWMMLPALALAQAGISPPKFGGLSVPNFLPEPSATIEPIIPAPQALLRAAPPSQEELPEKRPDAKIEQVIPVPKSGPAAEIDIPRRFEPFPAAALGAPCGNGPNPSCRPSPAATVNPGGNDPGTNFLGLGSPAVRNSLYWFTPEYLLWKAAGMHVPALASTSPAGTPAASAGVIGQPGASVLFGNQNVTNGFRSGLRMDGGFWFDESQTLGLDAGMFYLGQARQQGDFTSDGVPGVSRPYVNVLTGKNASEPVVFAALNPNGSLNQALTGVLAARVTSDLWGMDFNFRRFLYETNGFRLDGLIGYRYERLSDMVQTNSNSTVNDFANEPFTLPNSTQIGIMDRFQSNNDFQGGQLGLSAQWQTGRLSFDMNAKLAMGVNDRAVQINGTTTFVSPGSAPQTVPGGLLAQPTNIGRYSSSAFSVIPEVGFNVGYQLTPNIRVFGGYSFMYWTNVLRAGEQISTLVNPSQLSRTLPPSPGTLTGAAVPTYVAHEANYWAEGANMGLEFKW